jgi:hypothetical protein
MSRGPVPFIVLALSFAGCVSKTPKVEAPRPDPFVGLFGHPAIGVLELQRTDNPPRYRGTLWTELGPCPFEGSRDQDIVCGTVSFAKYGGTSSRLCLENTPRGFVLIDGAARVDPPLQRYKDGSEYSKWVQENPSAMQVVPTTRPAQ